MSLIPETHALLQWAMVTFNDISDDDDDNDDDDGQNKRFKKGNERKEDFLK